MNELLDFSACIVSGGASLARRIEELIPEYSGMCGEYFGYIFSKNGRRFEKTACGFLLLDGLLQKHGINRKELIISRGSSGRPEIINRMDMDFSVSHSDGAALCALAVGEDAAVGADIQRVRDYSHEHLEQLARAFMTASELEEFVGLRREDKTSFFYTMWTRREAFSKRRGGDIFSGLRGQEVSGTFESGYIACCGERYYYSISLPESGEAEKEIE